MQWSTSGKQPGWRRGQRLPGTRATASRARRGGIGGGTRQHHGGEGGAEHVDRHFRPRRFPAAPDRKRTAVAMASRGQVRAMRMRGRAGGGASAPPVLGDRFEWIAARGEGTGRARAASASCEASVEAAPPPQALRRLTAARGADPVVPRLACALRETGSHSGSGVPPASGGRLPLAGCCCRAPAAVGFCPPWRCWVPGVSCWW